MSTQSLPVSYATGRRPGEPSRAWHIAKRLLRWGALFLGAVVVAGLVAWLLGGQSPALLYTALTDTQTPTSDISGVAVSLLVGVTLLMLLVALVRFVLKFGRGPLAMARLVLDEALRNRVVVVIGGLLLIVLSWLPAAADLNQPLEYRIQTYLSLSLATVSLLLGAVTIFFACLSVSTDLAPGQTYDVFVKPVSRGSYLLGKWLGISLLNLCLLVSSFGVIYFGSSVWLGHMPALDELDRIATDNQVLTARRAVNPQPPSLTEEARQRFLQQDVPDFVRRFIGDPLEAYAASAWQTVLDARDGDQAFIDEAGGEAALFGQLLQQRQNEFLAIPPDTGRRYTFTGMGDIDRESGQMLQLRYKLDESAGYDRERTILLQIITDRGPTRPMPVDTVADEWQTQPINVSFINDAGVLDLVIINPVIPGRQPNTLNFEAADGLRILYTEGGFGINLAKSGAMLMAKLMALAMLGLAAAAALSFPVAATLSLVVWLLASAGTFLSDALRGTNRGVIAETPGVGLAYNLIIEGIGFAVALLRPFSSLDTRAFLIEGLLIPGERLAWNVSMVGLVTTLGLFLFGWFILSRREIARVQV
ncbi:MAG: ABC transporter permease [Phycisphaerae bacterium]